MKKIVLSILVFASASILQAQAPVLNWAKQIGGVSYERVTDIAIDASGNVFSTGYFNGVVDFDPGVGTFTIDAGPVSRNAFISKLDANGNFIWAKSFTPTSTVRSNAITLDAVGNIYIAGTFQGTVDFDPSIATYSVMASDPYDYDAFTAKFNANGNFLWANVFGSSGSDATTSLITDFSNNIIATGFFSGLTDFDSSPASYTLAPSAIDVFILQNNSTGNLGWVHQLASNDYAESTAIVVDNSNNIYTSGLFQGIVDFDPNAGILNIPSFGVEDGFINKMSPCLAPVMPNNITPITNLNICENSTTILSVTSAGSVNWYSSPASTLAIGSGTSFVTPTLAAGTYTFYAEATTCTISLTRLAITVSVTACTGINETQNRNIISVYPNPTNNNVTIELSNYTKQTTVEIINTVGEVVLKSNVTSPKNLIITDNLTSGIYFIKMENNIFKFIKY